MKKFFRASSDFPWSVFLSEIQVKPNPQFIKNSPGHENSMTISFALLALYSMSSTAFSYIRRCLPVVFGSQVPTLGFFELSIYTVGLEWSLVCGVYLTGISPSFSP
jgi:hypothetical protein